MGLLGEVEDPRLGRAGRVVWKAKTYKVVASHLCRLRTDGLAPVSKY
jgi:hypothetical protein